MAVGPGAGTLVISTVSQKICHGVNQDIPVTVPGPVPGFIPGSVSDSLIVQGGHGSSEETPVDSGNPGPFQGSKDPVLNLVAELYLLFWMVSSTLLLKIKQSPVSIGEDSSMHCPNPGCSCHDPRDVEVKPEVWSSSDSVLVSQLQLQKAQWFSDIDPNQVYQEQFSRL